MVPHISQGKALLAMSTSRMNPMEGEIILASFLEVQLWQCNIGLVNLDLFELEVTQDSQFCFHNVESVTQFQSQVST